MSVLEKIVARKKERLEACKANLPLTELKALAEDIPAPLDFISAISRNEGPIRFITEVKKASPSKGIIRQDFDHKGIAEVYKRKNVAAISVLTEEDFFQGRLEYLPEVKQVASLPVLRKDFIIDAYQVYEARANNADALLLIAAILEPSQADEYLHMTRELGMSVLFEVHDHADLEIALKLNAPIIGINNRNLKTLRIDLNTTFILQREIPAGRIVVSESGIRTRDDVLRLEHANIDAMLIGTSLMQSADIGKKIDQLRGTE